MRTSADFMRRGQKVESPVSGKVYEIDGPLGEGGFGKAYRAWELNRRGKREGLVCIKTTTDQASWHRESYFGELLSKTKRAIHTLDSFPIFRRKKPVLYALVMELAPHGTLSDYLAHTGNKPWTSARARREIVALLKMLDSMHAAGATHRDITPMNVFVSGNGTLKLGDFGIARHHVVGAPLTVDAFNPDFVTRGMRSYERRYWTPVDDIFQVGQLLAMLLTGQDEELLTPRQILALEGEALLLSVCARAIGPRRRRYRDAFSMLMALEGDELSAGPDLRSLEGKTVAFTGPMQLRRLDAEVLVAQAGGTVAKRVTKEVDVLVQGSRSPRYKSGHVGEKLAAARSLIKKGFRIHVIGEAQFRRLTLGEEHSG